MKYDTWRITACGRLASKSFAFWPSWISWSSKSRRVLNRFSLPPVKHCCFWSVHFISQVLLHVSWISLYVSWVSLCNSWVLLYAS